MDKSYAVKKKMADGKYFTFGKVKKNQYGNYSLGFKVTEQLKALVNGAELGGWLNLNMFEESDDKKPSSKPTSTIDDDEIAF